MPTTTTTPPPRITLRLRAWNGDPAGRTLIQGVIWDPLSECFYVHQADDVPGRKQQAIVIRRHDKAGVYRGFKRLPDAGHGSSIGAQPLEPGRCRLWIGHATLGPGYLDYDQGNGASSFQGRPALPQGDYSCDPAANLLLVRSGTLYRAYKLSDAAAGKATELYRFRVADWLNRFQGHLVAGGRLYVHRDKVTKGASELRSYSLPSGRKLRAWNTDPYGDEAEGAMLKDGWVYSVSRVGGAGPDRTVVCQPLELAGTPAPPPPPPKPKPPEPPAPPKPPALKRLHGLDVSSNNKTWAPAAGDVFGFVKSTEGTSYVNPQAAAQRATFRKAGLITGHYHAMWPGNAKQQAAYFVANTDIRLHEPIWCDWEQFKGAPSHPTPQDAAEWIAEVQRRVPTSRVLLYCNREAWMTTTVKSGDGLAIAEYGVTKPNTATDWVFWQYTETPRDGSWCKFTSRADLEAWLTIDRRPA